MFFQKKSNVLVQIDIDLATTTANLKDQETALASLQENHGVDGNQGALMDRLTVLQKGATRGV